jgi:predicted O-methyltransferase YrrM
MKFFLKYTLRNFFLFCYNLLLAPFSREARHKLSAAYLKLQYPYFGTRYVDLSVLLKNDDLQVVLAPVKARMHNTTSFELLSVCSLLKDNNASTVFEIGTYDGRTTRAMALNLANENSRIFTLNLPDATERVSLDTSNVDIQLASKVVSGERFLHTPQQSKITQLWGDSATFDFSPYYNSMDFIFIDGAHSEHYVKNDTEQAIKLIKNTGGIIVWHDAHLFGVVKYLEPLVKQGRQPIYFIENTTLAVARVQNGIIKDFLAS